MGICRTLAGLALVTALAAGAAADVVPDKPRPGEEDAGTKAVKAYLTKIKGDQGVAVTPIEDAAVKKLFPGTSFYAVLYRQYPVGRVPPEGLGSSNVFAVDKEGKATPFTKEADLEALFKKALPKADKDEVAKDAVRAWLRLSQEFQQDGFYKFQLMDDSTKVDGKKATGVVVVMQGGNGSLAAALEFDGEGKLAKAANTAKITPGPRPICQATKLLDADPVVRKMAEQDLLIMGRAAKPYLDEQRAVASPELRQAIDRLWQKITERE